MGSIAGSLYAVDRTTGTVTTIASPGGNINAIDFAADGTLYASNYDTNSLRTISPTGVVANIATVNGPSSIQVDEKNNRVLVMSEDGAGGRIYAVNRSTSVVTSVATNIGTDLGWAPQGMLWDGTRMVAVRDNQTVDVIPVTP